MNKPYPPLYYADYLQLEKLLSAQQPKSVEYGHPAHDEMLFIVVHQAYELWFKQMLHELDAVLSDFNAQYVDEKHIGVAVARLARITEIQKVIIAQLPILETMTPLDFLEFRDYLSPASGFQSVQFRLLENKLGLKSAQRLQYSNAAYHSRLSPEHRAEMLASEEAPSMFELLEKWLERTPFLLFEGFDFWSSYRAAVEKMLTSDRDIIESNPTLTAEAKTKQLAYLQGTEENFSAVFEEKKHDELVRQGLRRLSYKATKAALLINLYRDQPILHLPFRLLTRLVEIDELFTTWRYRHASMVQRMIGTKIGTGGSSGHEYLRATADNHNIFADFFNLSTFLIPRSLLPALPPDIERRLGFFYSPQ